MCNVSHVLVLLRGFGKWVLAGCSIADAVLIGQVTNESVAEVLGRRLSEWCVVDK